MRSPARKLPDIIKPPTASSLPASSLPAVPFRRRPGPRLPLPASKTAALHLFPPVLPPMTPPPKPGLHLKRPCLLVADLERALQFYRDILDFQLDYVGDASPSSYLYTVFHIPAQATLRFATLSTEHEARALALTEVKGITLPPPQPPYRNGTVIQVEHITPLMAQITALGLTPMPPTAFSAPPNLAFREQGVLDFDGNLVILYDVRIEADGNDSMPQSQT